MAISLIGIIKKDEEYLSVEGTIVDIVENYDPIDDDCDYSTYVDYEVEGKEYKNVEYGSYNSSMEIGDRVEVLYSPNNPNHIQAPGYKTVPYVVLTISSIEVIVGIVSLIKK